VLARFAIAVEDRQIGQPLPRPHLAPGEELTDEIDVALAGDRFPDLNRADASCWCLMVALKFAPEQGKSGASYRSLLQTAARSGSMADSARSPFGRS
jgi:hypothetical protein